MQYISRLRSPRYDLFISHAAEDKDQVARPLAQSLTERGLKVWYDETELRIGDNLRERIDEGIRESRFAVVILSPAFFAKRWTRYELDGIVQLVVNERHVLMPIWHNITIEEVRQESATLANIVAMSTASHSIEDIARAIHGMVIQLVRLDDGGS